MKSILLALLLPLVSIAQTTFTCTVPATSLTCTATSSAPPATCPPPSPPPESKACPTGQVGTITTTYSCVGTTWTASTVNSCTTPPVSGVVIRPLGPQGQSTHIQMQNGIIYSSQLVSGGVSIPKGQFSMTSTGQTPGGVQIEVTISPTPGDNAYYKTSAACYPQWGSQQCPCGGIWSPESPGVVWAPEKNPNAGPYCVTQAGWSVNYKMIGGSGEMVYFWQPS